MKNSLLLAAMTAIIVGSGGFFAGMKYQQGKQPSGPDFQTMGGPRQGFSRGSQSGTEIVRGEIINRDEKTMTVRLPDDSSKIVLISENTELNKATEGSIDDLQAGEQVVIFGQQNSDGSVSAAQIQLNFDFLKRPPQE